MNFGYVTVNGVNSNENFSKKEKAPAVSSDL